MPARPRCLRSATGPARSATCPTRRTGHMRWTREGANSLLQVRCAVLNGQDIGNFKPLVPAGSALRADSGSLPSLLGDAHSFGRSRFRLGSQRGRWLPGSETGTICTNSDITPAGCQHWHAGMAAMRLAAGSCEPSCGPARARARWPRCFGLALAAGGLTLTPQEIAEIEPHAQDGGLNLWKLRAGSNLLWGITSRLQIRSKRIFH
jgi:hypothetical protein